VLALLLSGCDAAWITVDLGTDPPADPEISAVQVNLLGLEFRKGDGTTATLEFRDRRNRRPAGPRGCRTAAPVHERRVAGGYLFRCAPALRPEPGPEQGDDSDGSIQLRVAEGAFAAVSFTVEDEKESRDEFTLMLDLRQSLSFDEVNDRYTLTPALRSVRSDAAARIEGNVAIVCPAGIVLPDRGAFIFTRLERAA